MRSGWTCVQVPVPSSVQGKLSRTVREGVNGQMKKLEGGGRSLGIWQPRQLVSNVL